MLARRPIPQPYREWNSRHRAPFGRRRGRDLALRLGARRIPWLLRWFGPYAWQENNTIRRFEYPWVFARIQDLGRPVSVLDVGAGMAGLQFTLAQAGHEVDAVDPGMNAKGKGSVLNPDFHAILGRAYKAPVVLWPTTIGDANLPDDSFDVVLSVSAIEHFAPDDIAEFARETRRVLRPSGLLVLTVDLFIDIEPFTSRPTNRFGRNVNVRQLLDAMHAELVDGIPEELYGFQGFDPERIQSSLGDYLVGERYPGLTQCLVARPLP